jgi:hypothetical protein
LDAYELFRFLLSLALAPAIFGIGKALRVPGARLPFLIGYAGLVVAFAINAFTSNLPGAPTDTVRITMHVFYAIGGWGFAWAAWKLRSHVLEWSGARR